MNLTAYVVLQVVVTAIVFILILRPDWTCKLIIQLLRAVRLLTVHIEGKNNIPAKGPAILVANHISFFDAIWIVMCTPRRVRFLVHQDFFRFWLMRLFLRYMGAVQVPGIRRPKAMKDFFLDIRKRLGKGELICFFPEGGISDSGIILQFKTGLTEMLPEGYEDIPVVPIRLGSLWGRIISLDEKHKFRFHAPRRIPIPILVNIGQVMSIKTPPFALRQRISELGAEAELKPFPGEHPLHLTFAIHAKQHPFKPPFKDFESKEVSNFSLLVRAILFSKIIRRLDPNTEDSARGESHVGVFLPNCTAQAMTLLGVMFADKIPAVLNYTSGRDTIRKAVEKANVKLILTSRAFLIKLNFEPMPEMIMLEDLVKQIDKKEKIITVLQTLLIPTKLLIRMTSPFSHRDVFRTAVVLFSSGSSGMPKAVELSHHNITSDILSFWRILNWKTSDRMIGNLPLFHAFGFTVCFAFPMISGTTTVYLTNPLEAERACRLIRNEKITMMMATPTFLQTYIRKIKPHDFDSLRLVITGAEKLRRDIFDSFLAKTGLVIVEGFGCTELSPIVSINLSRSFFNLGKECGAKNSVGVALPGIHVKIVDPDTGEELAPGKPGLLMVKGGLVMKGYLGDPEQTAAVLKDGFYNTGDIAYLNEDGYIFITGRLSRFSKIAGEMVPHELVEYSINEVLHTEDRCIAVAGRPDERRGEKLVVFYSIKDLDIAGLIAELRKRNLPNLWIPKAEDFIFVEKIPLLGSGKLDLQKLKTLGLPEEKK